jgi:hypothetical protein
MLAGVLPLRSIYALNHASPEESFPPFYPLFQRGKRAFSDTAGSKKVEKTQ